jgi:HEPN domain-containing protein
LEDAREWISRARSDLALARAKPQGVYLEDLCFHAQQAAEKAIKALLIRHDIEFPYVHDIAALMLLLEKATGDLPDFIRGRRALLDSQRRRAIPALLRLSGKRNTGKPSN